MKPTILTGDCRKLLAQMPPEQFQTCITSPPYWAQRDYGHKDQLGQEATPELYIANLVSAMREVHRCLKKDGTLWLVLGDTYCTKPHGNGFSFDPKNRRARNREGGDNRMNRRMGPGYKHKDLLMLPAEIAIALRKDGWYLRNQLIWFKRNCMPDSTEDRFTVDYENMFMLSKSERYLFNQDAVKEPCIYGDHPRKGNGKDHDWQFQAPGQQPHTGFTKIRRSGNLQRKRRPGRSDDGQYKMGSVPWHDENGMRNKRAVWDVVLKPFRGDHFATYPASLVRPMVLAATNPGDQVLDPFLGAGTTGLVAQDLGRRFTGLELTPKYAKLARARIAMGKVNY